jgi:hypothetical protein
MRSVEASGHSDQRFVLLKTRVRTHVKTFERPLQAGSTKLSQESLSNAGWTGEHK